MTNQHLLNKPPPGAQINLSHPLARGLVCYWLFNEQSGNQAYDLSPYHNHGTLHNFNDPSSKDRSSLGLQFDGSTTYVDCGDDASLNITDEITNEVWLNASTGDANKGIYSWYDGVGGVFMQTRTDALLVLAGTDVDYGSVSFAISGNWVHCTLVYDGSLSGDANRLKLYANGNIQTLTFNPSANIPATISTPGNLIIGNINTLSRFFDGTIDDVRIYNRALSADEIKLSYLEPYAMFYK